MPRLLISTILAVSALSACGSGVDVGEPLPQPTVPSTGPVAGAGSAQEAVEWWLAGLAETDYARVGRVVYELQMIVLVAAEGYSAGTVVQFAEEGLPEAVQVNFWDSFVRGVEGFSGRGVAALTAGAVKEFERYGRDFATVAIATGDREQHVVVARDVEERWWVDLVATFGATFARPLNTWRASLDEGPDRAPALALLAAQITSLRVALDLLPETPDTADSRAELAALIDSLG